MRREGAFTLKISAVVDCLAGSVEIIPRGSSRFCLAGLVETPTGMSKISPHLSSCFVQLFADFFSRSLLSQAVDNQDQRRDSKQHQ